MIDYRRWARCCAAPHFSKDRHGGRSGFAVLFLFLLAACTGLGGEPRIVATVPPRPALTPTAALPVEAQPAAYTPDLARGAAIFAERCTRCHGPDGAGAGELVASGEVPAMRSFLDAVELREVTPASWFDIVTNGRVERLMPPWRDALSPAERWDVTLYSFALRYPPGQIELGEALWQAHCADCHSEEGARLDALLLINLSDATLDGLVADGHAEAPALADQLHAETRWSLIAYVRSLLPAADRPALAQVPAPSMTEEAGTAVAAAALTGVIGGQITNGTAGAALPGGLPVRLFAFDENFIPQRYETFSDEAGVFLFEDAPLQTGYAYAVGVEYGERLFLSDFVRAAPGATALALPVTIYERTAEPSAIRIIELRGQITPVSGGVEIVQFVRFQNDADRIFSTDTELASGLFASVELPLPRGAQPLRIDDEDDRLIARAEPPALIDTIPVLPGSEHVVRIAYFLPLASEVSVAQPVAYPFEGRAEIFIHPNIITLAGGGFAPLAGGGIPASTGAYAADLRLGAGESIVFGLTAMPGAAITPAVVPAEQLALTIAAIVGGAGLMVAGVWLAWRSRRSRNTETIDSLIAQIAALDRAHEAGAIEPEVYQKRRGQLKARLTAALRAQDKPD